ncbi:MAG: N-acetyltransferase family protein [Bacteroidota bacterium]
MNIIREARPEDTSAILDIYAPFILHSRTSFEREVPSVASFQQRISSIQEQYPWLVYVVDETVAGYAYGSLHRKRHAYQWSTEVSAYVHGDFRRKGIAAALYHSLFACLRLQGYFTAFAGITLPNEASEKFHKHLGFKEIGMYENVGFKMGEWVGTLWLSKPIQNTYHKPSDIVSLASLRGTYSWENALASGIGG